MDWMRGLACLWVVFFHLNEPIKYVPSIYTNFCKLGWLGVPVFFVISGWCMAGITLQQREPKTFIAARLMRIFPPYWASLLVTAIAVVVIKLASGFNNVAVLPKSVPAIIATILLATSPATPVPAVNWVYWSLSFEVAFYALVAVGLIINKTPNRMDLWMMLLLLFAAATSQLKAGPVLNIFTFWSREFPLFALGWLGQKLFGQKGAHLIKWICCSGCLLVIAFSPYHGLLKAAIGTATLVALRVGDRTSQRPLPLLQWLGECSYSIYLTHVPIGCYLLLRLRNDYILNHLGLHVAYDVMTVILVAIFSSFFFCRVEAPFHRPSKAMSKKI